MTAERAKDWGDRYISDVGDVAPSDPTEAYQERDYRIRRSAARKANARGKVSGTPNLAVTPVEQPKKETFSGHIVKRIADGEFDIIRQDGKRERAYTFGDDNVYDEYRVGDPVVLMADQRPGYYRIVTSPRRKAMELLSLSNGSEVGPTMARSQIFMNVLQEQEGNVNDYAIIQGSGGFLITRDYECEYEVSITCHLKFEDARAEGSTLAVKAVCHGGASSIHSLTSAQLLATPLLEIDRTSGLGLIWRDQTSTKAGNAILTIGGPPVGFMLAPFTGIIGTSQYKVRWTTAPKIGRTLIIGQGSFDYVEGETVNYGAEGGGWLYLSSQNGEGNPTYFGLTAGTEAQGALHMPIGPVSLHSHLYAYQTGDGKSFDQGGTNVAKLKWTRSGGSGTLKFRGYEGIIIEIEVDKGIIVGATGGEAHLGNTNVFPPDGFSTGDSESAVWEPDQPAAEYWECPENE